MVVVVGVKETGSIADPVGLKPRGAWMDPRLNRRVPATVHGCRMSQDHRGGAHWEPHPWPSVAGAQCLTAITPWPW